MELEPLFVRALRLLHSRSRDSSAQLQSLLDETLRHRRGQGPPPSLMSSSMSNMSNLKRSASPLNDNKRHLERLKADLAELVPSKSARLSPSLMEPKLEPELSGLDMEDLCCVVCRSIQQEKSNKLMECATCQNLYHQECHQPPVSDEEADDPRLIWNCSNCFAKNPGLKQNSASTSSSTPSSTSLTIKFNRSSPVTVRAENNSTKLKLSVSSGSSLKPGSASSSSSSSRVARSAFTSISSSASGGSKIRPSGSSTAGLGLKGMMQQRNVSKKGPGRKKN